MDKLTPERRSANMSRLRSCDTSPEMIVRRLLHGMGYRYRLHVASLPGKPDIVLPRLNRIIEVRGCFWHQHKGCIDSHVPKSRIQYWGPKLEYNRRRDKNNERRLRRLGLQARLAKFLRPRADAARGTLDDINRRGPQRTIIWRQTGPAASEDLFEQADQRLVRLERLRCEPRQGAEIVVVAEGCGLVHLPGKKASAHWAERNKADPQFLACGQYLRFGHTSIPSLRQLSRTAG